MANRKKSSRVGTYEGFIVDVVKAMRAHGVDDAVIIFSLNEQLRNTYMTVTGEENPLYCKISDAFNAWLSQGVEN